MSLGGSSSSAKPIDMTPAAFRGMQQPLANTIGHLLGWGRSGSGVGGTPGGSATPGGSPAASSTPAAPPAPATPASAGFPFSPPGEDRYGGRGDTLLGINNGQVVPNLQARGADGLLSQQALGGSPGAGGTPSGPFNANDLLAGVPKYTGPLTTALGGNEQVLLDKLMAQQGFANSGGTASSAGGSASQQALLDIINGANGFQPQGSLGDFTAMLKGAQQTPGYSPDGNNPFVQAAIEAAQRPTMQALEEVLTRSLPGRFTQAGQFTNPQGSSAFDRAAAMASRDAGQTAADIASNISFGAFEAERGRQFDAQEGARTREAGAVENELGRRFEGGEGNRNRALDAAKALPAISRQEIDTTIANLQAQALPRLISELGIERGMEEFQSRVSSFLSTLGIAAGSAQPTITQESKSSALNLGLK